MSRNPFLATCWLYELDLSEPLLKWGYSKAQAAIGRTEGDGIPESDSLPFPLMVIVFGLDFKIGTFVATFEWALW